MTSPTRTTPWGAALISVLAIALATSACSRKKPPTTEITTETTAADTASMPPPPSEADRAAEMRRARVEEARLVIGEKIFFDFNRSEIKPEYREVLARKADVMNEFPELTIRIEGHCDERGTVEYNLALGERRAQAAKDYLVNAGIDPDRVATISYGEERPAVEGSGEEVWSQNRRDEFVIMTGFEPGV
jgi:peptidoglycan-associated lipoprotein